MNNVKYDLGALKKYFSDEKLSKMYGKSYGKSKYDNENYNEEDCYTYYGALINGRAVYEGYMEATKFLMNMAGIECCNVRGQANNGYYAMGHGWNIVKIDGKYYHVDTTWDDPIYDDGRNVLRHKYFNVSDEEMAKDHEWDREVYLECTE